MSDDLRTGPDAQANHILALLREEARDGEITERTDLLPGLHLHADEALQISGRWRSPPDRLLELDIEAGGAGEWMALHLALNAPDLAHHGVVGFAARTAAPAQLVIRPCLRSGTPEGFEDCFFDKHILSRPEEASHLDALPVHRRDRLPVHAPWRELILFLPTASLRWSLIDLRVFVV